jgi:undecaprenyl-diphosphatase
MGLKIWEVITYIILGLVQGIGEILPISSSGHLIIVQTLLNINNEDLTIEIFLHIASLIALLIYFRKELYNLIVGFFNYIFKKQEKDKKYFNWCIKIVIATIPAAVVGFFFEDIINKYFANIFSVGILLLINALVIYLTASKSGNRKLESISYVSSFIIGLFQAVAVLPGLSRSGTTIAGGKSQKLDKEDASLFAFMLFIPVTVGAFVLKLDNISSLFLNDSKTLILSLICFIVAFIGTYFSLKFIFSLIRQGKYKYFAYYSIVIGLFAIIYSFFK